AFSERKLVNPAHSQALRLVEFERGVLSAAIALVLQTRLVSKQGAADAHHLRICVGAEDRQPGRETLIQFCIQTMIVRWIERLYQADVADVGIRPPADNRGRLAQVSVR